MTTTTTYPPFRGYRFEEDEALRSHLSGLTVPNAKGTSIAVEAFFRNPQREERQTTYPNIMIDFLRWTRRANEEHRGWVPFAYEANTGNLTATQGEGFFPIPMLLHYQITTQALNIQHDVMVNDMLITSILPFRFGRLLCNSGTVRRLDVDGGPSDASTLVELGGDTKRLFRKVWEISISTEITPGIFYPDQVTAVDITITDSNSGVTETIHQP